MLKKDRDAFDINNMDNGKTLVLPLYGTMGIGSEYIHNTYGFHSQK